MAQRPLKLSRQWTSAQLEVDPWEQLKWYVNLAKAGDFSGMQEWEQLKWKDEFAAMFLRTATVIPIPPKTWKYPRGSAIETLKCTYLPTLIQMQEVQIQTARHIHELADGKGTYLGPFQVSIAVKFQHVHDAYGRQEVPRHIIFRNENLGESVSNVYEPILLRHMASLLELESYCDQIRRCPYCKAVFLQFRRHQEFCSRDCQSVAVMKKRRAEEKAKQGLATEKLNLTASAKGRLRYGKKRR